MIPTWKRLAQTAGMVVVAAGFSAGCADDAAAPLDSTAEPASTGTLVEAAPTETIPTPAPAETGALVKPLDLAAAAPTEDAVAPAGEIALKKLSWDQFRSQVATNPNAKYTLVDAWATTCPPCKENFPHLVEMNKKYGDKGLAVVSMTLDDREDTRAFTEAEEFLKEKGATFTNILLDEEPDAGYELLNINAIPAVFVFGPDGKEVKRFTMDDVDNQFTYEQVEQEVAALLGVEPPKGE